jgi:hypothetical protein
MVILALIIVGVGLTRYFRGHEGFVFREDFIEGNRTSIGGDNAGMETT